MQVVGSAQECAPQTFRVRSILTNGDTTAMRRTQNSRNAEHYKSVIEKQSLTPWLQPFQEPQPRLCSLKLTLALCTFPVLTNTHSV